jgi:hypothetical protein
LFGLFFNFLRFRVAITCGDFLDVVKIAQIFSQTVQPVSDLAKGCAFELRRPRRSSDLSPFELLFLDDRR